MPKLEISVSEQGSRASLRATVPRGPLRTTVPGHRFDQKSTFAFRSKDSWGYRLGSMLHGAVSDLSTKARFGPRFQAPASGQRYKLQLLNKVPGRRFGPRQALSINFTNRRRHHVSVRHTVDCRVALTPTSAISIEHSVARVNSCIDDCRCEVTVTSARDINKPCTKSGSTAVFCFLCT